MTHLKNESAMKLIIEVPCNNGEEMENNLNKAIDDFGTALKSKGFNEMELIAHNESVDSEPIYKITLSAKPKNESAIPEQTAMEMLIEYLRKQKGGVKGNSLAERNMKGAYTDAIVAASSLLTKEAEDKKKEAVAFAEWIDDNSIPKIEDGGEWKWAYNGNLYTTDQLYNFYQTNKT